MKGVDIQWRDVEDRLYDALKKKLGIFHEKVLLMENFHLVPISPQIDQYTNSNNTAQAAYYICGFGCKSGKVYWFHLWTLLDRKEFEKE